MNLYHKIGLCKRETITVISWKHTKYLNYVFKQKVLKNEIFAFFYFTIGLVKSYDTFLENSSSDQFNNRY